MGRNSDADSKPPVTLAKDVGERDPVTAGEAGLKGVLSPLQNGSVRAVSGGFFELLVSSSHGASPGVSADKEFNK